MRFLALIVITAIITAVFFLIPLPPPNPVMLLVFRLSSVLNLLGFLVILIITVYPTKEDDRWIEVRFRFDRSG